LFFMTVINGKFREYKLDNGLVVALQNTPTQTVAGKLRVNYGPSHERDGEEGMAHFLEHCLVTGGSERYDPEKADEIRGSFGLSNAYTKIGRTKFVVQMLSEDLESWLDYISDHVYRPRFDRDRVDGERERVLREISDAKSNPTYLANREFKNTFYRGHPKSIFILGKEDVIGNADQGKIRAFHGRGYSPNNMDLFVVGKLPDNVEGLIERYFGNKVMGKDTRREFPELEPLHDKVVLHRAAPDKLNTDNSEESSAQIFLTYLGPVDAHPDEYAVRTMNHILGGDTNSLLFQNLQLKKGLAYHAETSMNGRYNSGELGVNAVVPAKRIDEAVGAIFEELDRIKNCRVDDKKINRIKKLAKYNLAKNFESNEGHIIAIEVKLDKGLTPESFIEGFNKVTPEIVMEVANKYLPDRENGKYVLYIRDPLKD
jgi:predicted Zn-dependent peptidase